MVVQCERDLSDGDRPSRFNLKLNIGMGNVHQERDMIMNAPRSALGVH